ncbi:glycosyltransferase family 4 protein [Cellulophaga tyrosinoxydans]|uniref:Glycosyltransferase involved in cell wall bisynthesis n=1 Tax=Cellulophaga tyrosinoxydans TaxID=504486 RepID=A0A1W2AQ50_9FLAO|nr:glycosyltransferase family 4 protein [Cellulophaga tyrosinoxydans]SMC62859.1 Glycosyltransferase involved in cell wall bisynthesis [Cellulophaga tyrosinoxydans]
MKKKLLVFHNALAPYRVDFFNALHDKYAANFYFELQNVSDQKFDQDNIKRKCSFTCNYLEKGFGLFGRTIRFGIINAINRHKPDIIFCNEYSPVTLVVFIYTKLFKPNIKVYTLSDDSIMQSIDRKGIRSILRSIVTKNIEGVIFTSNEVSNWYYENISKKTKTLELPIIHNEEKIRLNYSKSIEVANQNIKKYELSNNKILLFIGRLVEVKNIDFLIKAVSKIQENNFKLIIVGEGELRDKLEDLVISLNLSSKIIFIGRKEEEELYNWYVFSQVFILPSIYEPYGAVINEALIGGCHILCSDHAGAASLIDKSNGQLFNPENEAELVEKIQNTLKNIKPLEGEVKFLRDNKMPFTFQEMIQQFFLKLE